MREHTPLIMFHRAMCRRPLQPPLPHLLPPPLLRLLAEPGHVKLVCHLKTVSEVHAGAVFLTTRLPAPKRPRCGCIHLLAIPMAT